MAETDVGADGCVDIGRITAQFLDHGLHHVFCDGGGGASPAGMGGANGTGHRVMEENGGAVGGEDHQGGTGVTRHQGVTLGIAPVERSHMIRFGYHPDPVGVGLAGQNQIFHPEIQGGSQNREVFGNIFFGFALFHGDVQTVKLACADAAEPGGKAVGHGDALCGKIF